MFVRCMTINDLVSYAPVGIQVEKGGGEKVGWVHEFQVIFFFLTWAIVIVYMPVYIYFLP